MSALLDRARASQWRVAMVVPLQGPAGLFGPSCEAVSELAARDLNSSGGVLGREVCVQIVDGGGDPRRIATEIRRLVSTRSIDAVSGWHISSVRHAIAPVVAGRVPYAYTSLYEGGESRGGVYCCGETPAQQIAPALKWLRENVGTRRWFVVGDDYIWPRGSLHAIRMYAHEFDLQIVGESFVDLGRANMKHVVDAVAAARCDGVVMLLVGQDAVEFTRAFARRGLADRVVRFSPLMEENMLLASGPAATKNLYVAAAYFRSLVGADSMDLLTGYVEMHGPHAPALNNAAESCYEGMNTLASLVARAGTADTADLDDVVDGAAFDGPRGTVEFRNRVARQRILLSIADGVDFEVLTAF